MDWRAVRLKQKLEKTERTLEAVRIINRHMDQLLVELSDYIDDTHPYIKPLHNDLLDLMAFAVGVEGALMNEMN